MGMVDGHGQDGQEAGMSCPKPSACKGRGCTGEGSGQWRVCACEGGEAAAGAGQPQMTGRAVGQSQAGGRRGSWGCEPGQGGQDMHADDTQINDLSCPHSERCFRVY